VRRFLLGAVSVGGCYLVLNLTGLVFDDHPTLMAILRPIGRLMYAPVAFVYTAFRLHDDDPRLAQAIMVASLVWALLGGVVAVLWARGAKGVRGR